MRPSFSPSTYRRLVLKVGSGILTGASGPRPEVLQALASQLAQLQQEGREVLVVSSGAVATGVAHLGLNKPRTLPEKQAAAAFGQPLLMEAWNQALQAYHLSAAQVLLTAEDIADRGRYLSLRETLETLLRWKVIPILNENDPVVAEEIKFGDNDQLSALIAILVEADLLLLLSEAGALYTQDPRTHPEASPLDEVERVTPELYRLAGADPGPWGSGGMRSKLLAIEKALAAGIPVLLLEGRRPGAILEVLRSAREGTFFHGGPPRYRGQRLWLLGLPRPRGAILIDEGAAQAIRARGASLLPSGVRGVEGRFRAGEPVRVLEGDILVGIGLVNYSAEELRRIQGAHTDQIDQLLGYKNADEVIHRNYFVLAGELEAH